MVARSQGKGNAAQEPALYLFFEFVTIAGALAVASTAALHAGAISVLEVVIWVAAIAASNILVIPIVRRTGTDATLGAPVNVAAAVLFPPGVVAGLIFVGSLNVREVRRIAPIRKALWNRAQLALSGAGGAWFSQLAFDNIVATTIVAAIVYQLANNLAVAASVYLRGMMSLDQASIRTADPYPRFALDFGLVTLLALFVVIAYDQVGAWAVALLAMPLWLGYSALRSARESEDRAEELADRVRELETLNELGSQLLSARNPGEVTDRAAAGLNHALGTEHDEIVLRRDGQVPAGLDVVKIPGVEPAAFGVPADLSDRSGAVVEAAAGLTGLALQRLELEEELAEMEKARRRLSEQILEEGQSERSRIALAIHDDVLPYFAAAEMQVDNVRTALQMPDASRAEQLSQASIQAVRYGVVQLREVLDVLRKRVLTPGELRPSLERALTDLELSEGTRTHLEAPDPLPPIPLAVEILVLETIRGCLTNVARHARAEHVTLQVDASEERVVAELTDDGVGFDPDEAGFGRHGLSLMAQRVELARGRLEIDSAPGAGTCVRLEVPL